MSKAPISNIQTPVEVLRPIWGGQEGSLVPCHYCTNNKPKFHRGFLIRDAKGDEFTVGYDCGVTHLGLDDFAKKARAAINREETEQRLNKIAALAEESDRIIARARQFCALELHRQVDVWQWETKVIYRDLYKAILRASDDGGRLYDADGQMIARVMGLSAFSVGVKGAAHDLVVALHACKTANADTAPSKLSSIIAAVSSAAAMYNTAVGDAGRAYRLTEPTNIRSLAVWSDRRYRIGLEEQAGGYRWVAGRKSSRVMPKIDRVQVELITLPT